MNYFKGLVSNVKGFYEGINPATLTGAIDVIVVRQEDGTFVGGPFHVRFGKLGVLRAKEKVVDISVNDKDIDLHMKLGDAGEAFFVQECQEEIVPSELATSPIPSSELLMITGIQELHKADIDYKGEADVDSGRNDTISAEAQFVNGPDLAIFEAPSPAENSLRETIVNLDETDFEKFQDKEKLCNRGSMLARSSDSQILETPTPNSPLKSLSAGNVVSSSIPIPKGKMQDRFIALKSFSDSDDLLSMPGSPIGEDLFMRNDKEYPLSDMDVPVSSATVKSSDVGEEYKTDPRRVLSDTEAELSALQIDGRGKRDDVTWEWGELPQGPAKSDKAIQFESARRKRLEKTTKSRAKQNDGLYLDDVLQADQEVAALYFNRQTAQMEGELDSGLGQDLKSVSPLESNSSLDLPTKLEGSKNGMPNKIAISLCGDLKRGKVDSEKFGQYLVSYEEFCKNPGILNNPNLVVKMDRKYYNWQVAAPFIMSLILYQKPLSLDTLKTLKQQHMPRKRKGWFTWRTTYDDAESSDEDDVSSKRHHKSRGLKSDTEKEVDGKPDAEIHIKVKDRYKKVTRLSSSQWQSLGLHDGANDITFSVTTQYQGTASCSARIFLWNYCDKIVISDIDGTITRSDVFGQILPLVGKDWSQSGVTGLFTNIEKNGYRFMYLSARAIGQAQITRDFLKSVRQGEKTLPDGPVFLSPTSLIKAFQREVIEKKPEIFKIACMKDIRNIFPLTTNPFYSGFGNRVNDVWAYRALGIPISRIFTINYKGEIKHELTNAFTSSYDKLVNLVDQMFPPLSQNNFEFTLSSDFSTFNYWKTPFPEIVDGFIPLSDDENFGL